MLGIIDFFVKSLLSFYYCFCLMPINKKNRPVFITGQNERRSDKEPVRNR